MYWRNWPLRWLPLKTSPSITSLRCCWRDARPPFVSAILAISAMRVSVDEGDNISEIREYDSRTPRTTKSTFGSLARQVRPGKRFSFQARLCVDLPSPGHDRLPSNQNKPGLPGRRRFARHYRGYLL